MSAKELTKLRLTQKNAINSKRAGIDARKPFILKHLIRNAAILD